MEDREDYYRKQAAEAEAQARRAKHPDDKAAWLRLVQDWLNLLPKAATTDVQRFDEQARADGTHQNVSDREQ